MTSRLDAGRTRPDWAGIAAVAAVALAASLAGFANAFAYDDIHMIQLNPRLHGLGAWREVLTSPYWPPPWNQEHYRPLTSLFLALQFGLGAGAPVVFRIASYLLYAAASVGVFVLAAKLLPRSLALAVGLLFAAHPVHVDAVAPAVGQSELVVGLLALLMTTLYLDRRRRDVLGPRDWGLLGLLYLAACLAKEHGMILPTLLIAVELFLLPGPLVARARKLWAGYAFLGALAGAVVAARLVVLQGRFSGHWIAEALEGLPAAGRALTMLQIVPHWARLLLWPAHLQSDYSPQDTVASTRFGAPEAFGAFVLLGALAALWLLRKRAPVASFGLAWAAVSLLPASNLLTPTSTLLAERQLFLPSMGFLLAVGAAAAALWDTVLRPAGRRKVLAGVVALLVVAGVARSAERQRIWRNEAYFAVRGVQDAPRSYRTQRGYAEVLFELGQRELAVAAYREALALAPAGHRWRVRNDFARRLRGLGESAAEVEQLGASLAQHPDQFDTRGNLIAAYLALGRYPEAVAQADTALARGGDSAVFVGLRALADSAARAGAAPGTIRIRIVTTPASSIPPGR